MQLLLQQYHPGAKITPLTCTFLLAQNLKVSEVDLTQPLTHANFEETLQQYAIGVMQIIHCTPLFSHDRTTKAMAPLLRACCLFVGYEPPLGGFNVVVAWLSCIHTCP